MLAWRVLNVHWQHEQGTMFHLLGHGSCCLIRSKFVAAQVLTNQPCYSCGVTYSALQPWPVSRTWRPGCTCFCLSWGLESIPHLCFFFPEFFSPNTKLWDTLNKGWRHVPLREISHYSDTTCSCASSHYIFLEIPPIVFVYMAFCRQAHENSTNRASRTCASSEWKAILCI